MDRYWVYVNILKKLKDYTVFYLLFFLLLRQIAHQNG